MPAEFYQVATLLLSLLVAALYVGRKLGSLDEVVKKQDALALEVKELAISVVKLTALLTPEESRSSLTPPPQKQRGRR